ncbi:hypothetical protein FRB96_005085 [Tulasnella sp. 330]|nr:hypothetical protein FRB96_005085 [Tulasnella sp. 330]KAG8885804.1 hypothetical protein FRB97_009510 [Tulasnella sp. 331]
MPKDREDLLDTWQDISKFDGANRNPSVSLISSDSDLAPDTENLLPTVHPSDIEMDMTKTGGWDH